MFIPSLLVSPRRPFLHSRPSFAFLLAAALAGMAQGQVAPAVSKTVAASEPVTLSVFEVRSDKDVGYQGGNTLSGSRLDSSLRDTAASVMVFTPEFISDFGANGLAEMTAYSPNLSVDMLETSSAANPVFIGGSDLVDTRIVVRGLDLPHEIYCGRTTQSHCGRDSPSDRARVLRTSASRLMSWA